VSEAQFFFVSDVVVVTEAHASRSTSLQPYFRQIIVTLLTRMQQNKTNAYSYYFVYFLLYMLAINIDGLTPDYLIQIVDEIQPGYD
jgi:exportin-2 (importin alpha re-exporter)